MMDTCAAAQVVRGRAVGECVRFARVATDTRSLAPGDLFVALKGERFDGHDFVPSALAQGAAAAMVAEARARSLAGNLVVVAEPLAALGALAAHWRRRFAIPVILVVGSNGKTTVKEMLASILRTHFGDAHVLATRGNLNNAIGLPLTLLALRDAHRVASVELGMNHRGETAELAPIAQPTVVVVTNAQREHQEFMASVDDVAIEHAAAIEALAPGGIAVLNADDAHVDVWRDAAAARPGVAAIEFALDHPAVVRGRASAGATTSVELATSAGDATVRLAIAGRHNAANALAATTAALAAGVPLADVVRGLEAFRPAPGRLVALRAPSGAAIIDDTYNANPDSVRAAIDVLAAAPAPRWLVLGDMGEVGAQGPAFHREVGAYARAAGIERLYGAGGQIADAVDAFGAGALHFSSADAAAVRVADDLRHGDAAGTTVLVKGSRFMRMERVVQALTGSTAAAGEH
jgi:UDP-N-acetylmuramoyl-tripeptide--D-alanyl-D-alanine ligase